MASATPIERTDSRIVEASEAGDNLAALLDYVKQRPSLKERLDAGKALRSRVPRADHGHYKAAANRLDPIGILEMQNATRVEKLVPVRFARMLASPFAFLRGTAAVMSADLAPTPTTGIQVQALAHAKSGDAAMIAGYCGKSSELDDAIARFSLAYEKQTNQDHAALDKTRKSGRIRVASSEVVK